MTRVASPLPAATFDFDALDDACLDLDGIEAWLDDVHGDVVASGILLEASNATTPLDAFAVDARDDDDAAGRRGRDKKRARRAQKRAPRKRRRARCCTA